MRLQVAGGTITETQHLGLELSKKPLGPGASSEKPLLWPAQYSLQWGCQHHIKHSGQGSHPRHSLGWPGLCGQCLCPRANPHVPSDEIQSRKQKLQIVPCLLHTCTHAHTCTGHKHTTCTCAITYGHPVHRDTREESKMQTLVHTHSHTTFMRSGSAHAQAPVSLPHTCGRCTSQDRDWASSTPLPGEPGSRRVGVLNRESQRGHP